jgi:micrococcal nuclease
VLPPSRRLSPLALAAILPAVLAIGCASAFDDEGATGNGETRTTVRVVEVVDGDTIRVDLNGEETPVRLIGIDTPEKDGPYTDEECFGVRATQFTARALGGRDVELEFDVERTDRYDRTLAYVWIDDSLFNERILREGYAVLATCPPNVRYVDRFTTAQQRARDGQAGLWGACPGQ